MTVKNILLLLVAVFPLTFAAAQTTADSAAYRTGKWFHYVPYGHSLYADEHPDFVRMDLGPVSYSPATDYAGSGHKYGNQIMAVFGGRISVWSMDLQQRRYGMSISQTFSVNLWMDITERTTSPVVNTDYRIAIPTFTFIQRFGQQNAAADRQTFLKNYSIQLCPFKHESTHIGDEMVLQRADKGYALRRVNVNYNYAELLFTLNEPENRYAETHTFRLGAHVLLDPKQGWYSVNSADGAVNNIPSNSGVSQNKAGMPERFGPSGMPFEVWLQYQYQSACSKHGFQAIVSAEVRNRAMYAYSLTETTIAAEPQYIAADRRRFTYSVFVGMRYNMPHYDGYFSRFSIGVRAYHGNCPYGMFRSVDNFSHAGLCIVYQ